MLIDKEKWKSFLCHTRGEPSFFPLIGYFALGALSTLGWAPFHAWPITWIAIIIILQSNVLRYHASFLFGFSLIGFHWLIHAFSVVGLGVWGPGAVILLALGLTFLRLIVIMCFVYAFGWRAFPLAIGYACSEWIQGHVLTGLPWHLLAYTWGHPACWQSVAWWGSEGLSALMWLSMGILACKRWVGVALVWVGLIGWGYYHLHHAAMHQGNFRVRLVHPCIDQSDKWKKSHFNHVMGRMDALSSQGSGVDMVVWPEAAIPTWMSNDLAMWAWPHATALVTGAIRHDDNKKLFNCLCIIRNGVVESVYDKRHLTPFGEYMPLWLPFSKLTHGTLDYSAGETSVILHVKNKRFWPIICFESIFGREMAPPHNEKLDGVILVTNDGWFGTNVGPQQHAHMARFRAVEWNLPVIRVANNGISSVIDRYGRIISSIPLDQIGALEAILPE